MPGDNAGQRGEDGEGEGCRPDCPPGNAGERAEQSQANQARRGVRREQRRGAEAGGEAREQGEPREVGAGGGCLFGGPR